MDHPRVGELPPARKSCIDVGLLKRPSPKKKKMKNTVANLPEEM